MKNELETRLASYPVFDFVDVCKFLTQGEICILAKYKTVIYDEKEEECEFVHAKVQEEGMNWIIQNVPDLKHKFQ